MLRDVGKHNNCKHEGQWILLLHAFPLLTSTSKYKLDFSY